MLAIIFLIISFLLEVLVCVFDVVYICLNLNNLAMAIILNIVTLLILIIVLCFYERKTRLYLDSKTNFLNSDTNIWKDLLTNSLSGILGVIATTIISILILKKQLKSNQISVNFSNLLKLKEMLNSKKIGRCLNIFQEKIKNFRIRQIYMII